LYNYAGASNKNRRDGTLKKREELKKSYELRIRKQIADGELKIP